MQFEDDAIDNQNMNNENTKLRQTTQIKTLASNTYVEKNDRMKKRRSTIQVIKAKMK